MTHAAKACVCVCVCVFACVCVCIIIYVYMYVCMYSAREYACVCAVVCLRTCADKPSHTACTRGVHDARCACVCRACLRLGGWVSACICQRTSVSVDGARALRARAHVCVGVCMCARVRAACARTICGVCARCVCARAYARSHALEHSSLSACTGTRTRERMSLFTVPMRMHTIACIVLAYAYGI